MAEPKYLDQETNWPDGSNLQINKVPRVRDLSAVPQGTTDTDRIGDKLTVTSVEIRGRIYFDWATTPAIMNNYVQSCRVRLVVFIWKDDTVPIASDIIQSIGYNAGNVCSAPFNHDKKVKRKVICDKTWTVQNDGYAVTLGGFQSVPGAGSQKAIREYCSFKHLPLSLRTINYQAGSTIGVNKVYAMLWADANEADAEIGPQCFMVIRLNYKDT